MAKKTPVAGSAGFTDTRRVKELIALMADHGLTEIELVEDKSRILLRRGGGGGVGIMAGSVVHTHGQHAAGPVSAPAAAAPVAAPDADLIAIKSPMVGTFYSAPSPSADPYVAVGTIVGEKTTVCIVEAMKVMNPVHAECSGTIAKVLVSNGQVVEFGQTLFLVKPA